jgi:hypothetical protein
MSPTSARDLCSADLFSLCWSRLATWLGMTKRPLCITRSGLGQIVCQGQLRGVQVIVVGVSKHHVKL